MGGQQSRTGIIIRLIEKSHIPFPFISPTCLQEDLKTHPKGSVFQTFPHRNIPQFDWRVTKSEEASLPFSLLLHSLTPDISL